MVDPIPFLLPGRQQTVGAVRVPPRGLGLLEPGQQHGLQRDHVVVGERQGLEPGTPALQSTHTPLSAERTEMLWKVAITTALLYVDCST